MSCKSTWRERPLPLSKSDVTPNEDFSPEELLYRRVRSCDLVGGELSPTSLNSLSFSAGIGGAPSVLRSRISEPSDALHPDCCGGRELSGYLVYSMQVQQIPGRIDSDGGDAYVFYPVHRPEPACGAHSVIASSLAGDAESKYAVPPRNVRNKLRSQLVRVLTRTDIASES